MRYNINYLQRTWEKQPEDLDKRLLFILFLPFVVLILYLIFISGNFNLALCAYFVLPMIMFRPIIGIYVFTIIIFISPLTFEMGGRQLPSPRETIGLFTLGFGILQMVVKKEELSKYSLYSPLILVFVVLLGFALIRYGSYSRTVLISFSSGVFAYILVTLLIKNPEQVKYLLVCLAIAYLLNNIRIAYRLILAVSEYGASRLRSEAEFLGYAATSLSWLQVLAIPVILGLILTTKHFIGRLFWIAVLLVNYVVALLCVTRGALLTLSLSLLGFFLLNKQSRVVIAPFLIVLFFGFILFYLRNPSIYSMFVEQTLLQIANKQARVPIYLSGIHTFIKNPLWGVGATGALSHSFFLGAARDYGLIYLIPLFFLFYKSFQNGLRLVKTTVSHPLHPLCVGLFVSFLASVVQSIFDSTFMSILYGMTFWMLRGIETVYLNTLRGETDTDGVS